MLHDGPAFDRLCRDVAAAPDLHDVEPAYLDADGPMEPERVVSMGVAERIAAVIDGHGPEPEAILAAVREHGRPYSRSTLRNGPGAVLAEISGDGFWKGRTPDADGVYRVTLAVTIPPDAPGAKSNIIAYGLNLTRTTLESEARRGV